MGHQTSTDLPSARSPKDRMATGISLTLAIVTTFGYKSCYPARDQKLAKSGAGTTSVAISTPLFLNSDR